jgi:uncharacterized membrane protein
MQSINVAILNGWFFLGFLGALVLPAVAAVLHLGRGSRAALPWIVAGLVLYVVVLVVTWNVVRALASTAALGCLAWALVAGGRLTT